MDYRTLAEGQRCQIFIAGVDGGEPQLLLETTEILLEAPNSLNNDHVLGPDGETIYLSANDGHIHRAPLAGGRAERITNDGPPEYHFLHGVSPDGDTLAYIGLEPAEGNLWARANVFTIPSAGGDDTRLTDTDSPADGSEYSPDRQWIYVNTEQFSETPGHAQIARMRPGGSDIEQLTFDDVVNWFPHWSPTSDRFAYVAYPLD